MRIVLDNVIAEGSLPPVLAVFVDPREPGNTPNNRRQSQYADDYETFAAFLADELVPAIDRAYKTDPAAERRAILGTSLGGLFSAYLGAAYPAVFGCLGIHSPAFRYDAERNQDRIVRMYSEAEPLPLTIFMSTGTLHDTQDGARRMAQVLEGKGYTLQYLEVNEGHSWGNWRGLIDDPLRFCWNPAIKVDAGEAGRDG
jgi:enterochelin esterase family protein